MLGAGLGFAHDTFRLMTELPGHLLVAALHFFVGDIQLGVACGMGRNLGGFGSGLAVRFEMVLDLFASRAGSFDVFLAVAFDLRRSMNARLDLVSQFLQAQGQFGAIDRGCILLRLLGPENVASYPARCSMVFSFSPWPFT